MFWKLWIAIILGIFTAILPFLGFTLFMYKAGMFLSGILSAFLIFWFISEQRLK